MKRLAPFLALLVAGVALAAEPVAVTLTDEADAKAALVAHESCASACATVKVFRARLVQAEAEEFRCKQERARVLSVIATKLGVIPGDVVIGVKGPTLSVRVTKTVDGDGAEVRTVVLVASQE